MEMRGNTCIRTVGYSPSSRKVSLTFFFPLPVSPCPPFYRQYIMCAACGVWQMGYNKQPNRLGGELCAVDCATPKNYRTNSEVGDQLRLARSLQGGLVCVCARTLSILVNVQISHTQKYITGG